jgi:hypothetical protein
MMTQAQVMEELEAIHEFVLEVIQEAEDDHRLHELRFEDVIWEARREFGVVTPPIQTCMKGWVVMEFDRRAKERLSVKDKENVWQERRDVHKAVLRERKMADLGQASKAVAKGPPPVLPRR